MFKDLHAEPDTPRPGESARARHARAAALTKLIPLRVAKRRFPTLQALAKEIEVEVTRVGYWREKYPSARHIIKKLLDPPSE